MRRRREAAQDVQDDLDRCDRAGRQRAGVLGRLARHTPAQVAERFLVAAAQGDETGLDAAMADADWRRPIPSRKGSPRVARGLRKLPR